jgi:hypothetical protein
MRRTGIRTLAMLAAAGLLAAFAVTTAVAQSSEGLRIGILGGINYNYLDVAMQEFVTIPGNTNFTLHDFSQGSEFTGFGGISGEYLFDDMIGAMLRTTFDYRCLSKEDNGSTFTPHLAYVTVEPGVRVNLVVPELHAMAGGTVAFRVLSEYDYTGGNFEGNRDVNDAPLENVRDVVFGAWAGFGYDIGLEAPWGEKGMFITPFVEGSYLFDQKNPDRPLPEEKYWNTLTVRGGVQIKARF